MKWHNIRYDQEGKPIAIIASGSKEDFKTDSPVAARLPPDIQSTLYEWATLTPHNPDDTILTNTRGNRLRELSLLSEFYKMAARWHLPKLLPKSMRHWVCSVCRRVGLSKPASAALVGHDAASGPSMRDWYDNPQTSEIFDEQSAKLPNGPLGILDKPKIVIIQGLPSSAVELLRDYLEGRIGLMEFMARIEKVKPTITQSFLIK